MAMTDSLCLRFEGSGVGWFDAVLLVVEWVGEVAERLCSSRYPIRPMVKREFGSRES